MSKLTHPLISWCIAIVMFITLPAIQHFNGGLLSAALKPSAELRAKSKQKKSGLLLTSSGLYCTLNNGTPRLTDPNFNFQSLYLPLASVSSFAKVESALARVQPDFIILQGSVLTRNPETKRSRNWLHQLKRYWIATLSSIHPAIRTAFVRLQCSFATLERDQWQSAAESGKANHLSQPPYAAEKQRDFIRKMLSYNKPILITNQPIPHIGKSYKELVDSALQTILKPISAGNNFHILHYPTIHDDSLFYDPYHLKSQLGGIFSEWLDHEASKLIIQ